MYMRVDWNNIKTIKTHQSSAIQSGSYADHIIRIMARIARNRIMYRDEYLAKCEQITRLVVCRNGWPSTMRSISSGVGYGRIIGGSWEIKPWEVERIPSGEGSFCHIDAMTAPYLYGNCCFRCKSYRREKQSYLACCETCQQEADSRSKTIGRIWRDEQEAKEIRSLTRKLERCIREKVKATASIPHQHHAAD